jgi:hypothetical protein
MTIINTKYDLYVSGAGWLCADLGDNKRVALVKLEDKQIKEINEIIDENFKYVEAWKYG